MIVCPVLGRAGRLGNQLWQIASTLGVADSRGREVSFPEWDYAPFFSIPDRYFSNQPGIDVRSFVPHLSPDAATYLQDYSLFSGIARQIELWFKPSTLAQETIETCGDFHRLRRPILSVHVRRGDNVPGADPGVVDKHLYHPLPPLDYYQRAIAMCDGYQSIAVFSDDPEWCVENIPADYYHFGQPRAKEHLPEYNDPFNDWLDLFLMAQCDGGHVVPNSTYGWWGAFLSGDETPIVPKPWFGPRIVSNADLMFPKGWRQLEREPNADTA